jgi:hypothetical protein
MALLWPHLAGSIAPFRQKSVSSQNVAGRRQRSVCAQRQVTTESVEIRLVPVCDMMCSSLQHEGIVSVRRYHSHYPQSPPHRRHAQDMRTAYSQCNHVTCISDEAAAAAPAAAAAGEIGCGAAGCGGGGGGACTAVPAAAAPDHNPEKWSEP